jgi:hypothetical protein
MSAAVEAGRIVSPLIAMEELVRIGHSGRQMRSIAEAARPILLELGSQYQMGCAKLENSAAFHIVLHEEAGPFQLSALPTLFFALGIIASPSTSAFLSECLKAGNVALVEQYLYHGELSEAERRWIRAKLALSMELPSEEKKGSSSIDLLTVRKAYNRHNEQLASQLLERAELFESQFSVLAILCKYAEGEGVMQAAAHRAIHMRSRQGLACLLEAGLDCDLKLKNGFSLLHYAAKRHFEPGVRLLLESGASPDLEDDLGRTPLLLAMESIGPMNLQPLIELTDCDRVDYRGTTPLHFALSVPSQARWEEALTFRTESLAADCDGVGLQEYALMRPRRSQGPAHYKSDSQARGWGEPNRRNSDAGRLPFASWEKVFGHINSTASFGFRDYNGIYFSELFEALKKLPAYAKLPDELRHLTDDLPSVIRGNQNRVIRDIFAHQIGLGHLTIIPVQTLDHVFYIVFWDRYLAVCERMRRSGAGSDQTLSFYRYDRNTISPEMLQTILGFQREQTEKFHTRVMAPLLSTLKCVKTEECRMADQVSLSFMRIENCVYANLKAAWRAALVFQYLRQGKSMKRAAQLAKEASKKVSTEFRLSSIAAELARKPFDQVAVLHAVDKCRRRPQVRTLAEGYFNPLLEEMVGVDSLRRYWSSGEKVRL